MAAASLKQRPRSSAQGSLVTYSSMESRKLQRQHNLTIVGCEHLCLSCWSPNIYQYISVLLVLA